MAGLEADGKVCAAKACAPAQELDLIEGQRPILTLGFLGHCATPGAPGQAR